MTEIIVVGYPKSGNTWLSRLLGEVLQCPVTGIGTAKPLASEGATRDSPHVVRQLHLKATSIHNRNDRPPGEWTSAVDNAYWFGYELHDAETTRLIHIIRDPRDVAVSVFYYWQRGHLRDAVEAMCMGSHPLKAHGPWHSYIKRWLDCPVAIPMVKYERLLIDPLETLRAVVTILGFDVDVATARSAINAQSFAATRDRIKREGDGLPYGKEIQLRNLRKGSSGDWRDHFDRDLAEWANRIWGPYLHSLNYENNLHWWRELP